MSRTCSCEDVDSFFHFFLITASDTRCTCGSSLAKDAVDAREGKGRPILADCVVWSSKSCLVALQLWPII